MANKKNNGKRFFNMAYSLGAAVVIIGALFKIQHISIGPLTGGVMLMLGMGVEAVVFFLSAFEPVEEELDWSRVYPELKDDSGTNVSSNGMLAKKLDGLLKEAKLDATLMSDLSNNIKNFSGAAEGLVKASDSIVVTNKYNDQVSLAATQMETLNGLYQAQVQNASKQAELNASLANNAEQLQQQMQSLATNLSSLNGVYGGMLSAMGSKN